MYYIQEYWCKKLHPKNVCEKVFRQPPLRESLRKGKLKKQEFTITKQKAALLQASDSIGMKIQYDCPGFLPNRRQVKLFLVSCSSISHGLLIIIIFLSFSSNPFSAEGPWNWVLASGISVMKPNPLYDYKYVVNEDEVYVRYTLKNSSVISIIVVNQTLNVRQCLTWIPQTRT